MRKEARESQKGMNLTLFVFTTFHCIMHRERKQRRRKAVRRGSPCSVWQGGRGRGGQRGPHRRHQRRGVHEDAQNGAHDAGDELPGLAFHTNPQKHRGGRRREEDLPGQDLQNSDLRRPEGWM